MSNHDNPNWYDLEMSYINELFDIGKITQANYDLMVNDLEEDLRVWKMNDETDDTRNTGT